MFFQLDKRARRGAASGAQGDRLDQNGTTSQSLNGHELDELARSNPSNGFHHNGHERHGGSMEPREPLIRMRGVSKAYDTANGSFLALKRLNLDIYPGEFVAIVGKSGAGKTTLINMLTGVDHLTSGEVWVDGMPVHSLDENKLALWRGRKLGIIYQSFYLMPTLSLLQNVTLPMDFCGLYQGRRSAERALDLLRQVELEAHAHKLPSAISGGQQQRVAIARALANDPPIIVADEPTGRLDSVTAEVIFRIFQELVAQGKTILMVTHDRSLAQRVSRTIHIADGEVVPELAHHAPVAAATESSGARGSIFGRMLRREA